MSVAGEGVGGDFKFHGCAPLRLRPLRGVDFHTGMRVRFPPGTGQVHGGAVGRERHYALFMLGVKFAFDRFGSLPFAAFVFARPPDVALFHAGDFASVRAGHFLVCRCEVDGVVRLVEEHG